MQTVHSTQSGEGRISLFDDRYGIGAHRRLIDLLAQPRLSFAQIAEEFGVTRERVRQWHGELLPDSPKGHARRRLRTLHQARQRLLTDPLFGAFYRQVKAGFEAGHVGFIRSSTGLRSRLVRLNGSLVAIKRASPRERREGSTVEHVLTAARGPAEFVYYQLGDDDFLFVPRAEVPAGGTTFIDSPSSKYQRYRHTFAAVPRPAAAESRVN